MQKALLSLTAAMSMLIALSGCQPKVEKPAESNNTQKIEQDNPQLLSMEQPKQAVVTEPAIDAKTCLALSKSMQKVGDTSKIEAIYTIQKQLKACLPTASNAEVLSLLENYQAMYRRFLQANNYLEGDSLFEVAEALEKGNKIPLDQLSAMSPRQQYLVHSIQKGDDIRLLYIGEGLFVFNHDLIATANLFAPYLSKAQAAFIQRMAKDNQDIFWNDASVAVPYAEVIERAVFWENYIKTYPNSSFIEDAKDLFTMYRYVLFFGSDNTDWLNELSREFYEPEHEQLMKQLSQRPNSIVVQDAQNLLRFMKMSDDERQDRYPVDTAHHEDNSDSEWAAWSTASEQLEQALSIPSPWKEDNSGHRDCLISVICVDYDY